MSTAHKAQIFISYSHDDETCKDKLEKNLMYYKDKAIMMSGQIEP